MKYRRYPAMLCEMTETPGLDVAVHDGLQWSFGRRNEVHSHFNQYDRDQVGLLPIKARAAVKFNIVPFRFWAFGGISGRLAGWCMLVLTPRNRAEIGSLQDTSQLY